jgi:hypothetical protein
MGKHRKEEDNKSEEELDQESIERAAQAAKDLLRWEQEQEDE